jgi:hypothetical protein
VLPHLFSHLTGAAAGSGRAKGSSLVKKMGGFAHSSQKVSPSIPPGGLRGVLNIWEKRTIRTIRYSHPLYAKLRSYCLGIQLTLEGTVGTPMRGKG